MADHFLTKSQLDLAQCLNYGGGLALDSYAALHALFSASDDPSLATLFAEPLLSRGNDVAPASVSWYTDLVGDGRMLSDCDDVLQSRVRNELSRRLRAMRPLLADREDGTLLAAAMHIAGPVESNVWVVDGQPVIINWGMLPSGIGQDQERRNAHYASTLGRFLPLASAPPLTETERKQRVDLLSDGTAPAAASVPAQPQAASGASSGAAPATGFVSAAAAIPPGQGGNPAGSVQDAPRRGIPVIAWLPLLLLIISAIVLIWLTLPFTRIFPTHESDRAIQSESAAALARSVNESLRERVATLRESIDGAICRADGTLLLPEGLTLDGLLPPDANNPNDVPGTAQPASPTPVLPPSPGRVQLPVEPNVPSGVTPQDDISLLGMIETRTVMIIAEGSDGVSTGSGFFIGPDFVVTNHHVVRGAAQNGVFVTNSGLGRLHQAQVLKVAGPFDVVGADFALLRVPNANNSYYSLLDATETLKLQSVVAAGYPGDVLETDNAFQRLRSGDTGAVPDLTVTDGSINTQQNLGISSNAVVHSAPISQGKSGGPLVDMCGRVVGVNTFVRQGELRNLNFALAIPDLIAFLDGTGAVAMVEQERCAPQLLRPVAPVAEADVVPATPAEEATPSAQATPTEN